MQLRPHSYTPRFSDFLRSYYLAPNHPFKLRILGWLEAMGGKKRIAVKTHAGFRFAVDRRDYIQRTIYETRRWEPEIEAYLQTIIGPEDVFYDIGANSGYFSLYALQAGCRHVIAFEPSLELAAIYQYNMHLNNFLQANWQLFNCALSDVSGVASYLPGPIQNSGIGQLSSQTPEEGQQVDVCTLDTVIDEGKLPRPSIIKLDVEGWELKILKGALQTFSINPPRYVIFEADANSNGDMIEPNLLTFFLERGYTVEHLKRKRLEAKENYVAVLNNK